MAAKAAKQLRYSTDSARTHVFRNNPYLRDAIADFVMTPEIEALVHTRDAILPVLEASVANVRALEAHIATSTQQRDLAQAALNAFIAETSGVQMTVEQELQQYHIYIHLVDAMEQLSNVTFAKREAVEMRDNLMRQLQNLDYRIGIPAMSPILPADAAEWDAALTAERQRQDAYRVDRTARGIVQMGLPGPMS